MGFSIYIGPLCKEDNTSLEEYNEEHCMNMPYGDADQFAELHPGIWAMLRRGDTDGADPVIVPLDQHLITAINEMPPVGEEGIDSYSVMLQTVLDRALTQYEGSSIPLFVETR